MKEPKRGCFPAGATPYSIAPAFNCLRRECAL